MKLDDLPSVALVFVLTGFMFVIGIVILSSFQSNVNIGYAYVASTGGTDYFGVNNNASLPNVTTMTTDQDFGFYTAFTPRLNFTVNVTGTLTGKLAGQSTVLRWLTPLNISPSFVLRNATAIIGTGNYSLVQTGNNWNVTFLTNNTNGSTLTYYMNRTFIKNVDDLYTNASGIYSTAVTGDFVILTVPSGYGSDPSFYMNGTSLGNFTSLQNYAVTWTYTQRNLASSSSYTSLTSSITALSEIPNNWLLLIAVIIAASIVIGVVIDNMRNPNGRN